jgi:hypothetical protein
LLLFVVEVESGGSLFSQLVVKMLVHFVTDEPTKIAAIRAMLEPRYHVVPQLLGGGDNQISSNGMLRADQ